METTILKTIATNIKKHREQKHLSQEQLADKSGLHRTYISLLERKKKNVSIVILEKLAKALQVDICDLIK